MPDDCLVDSEGVHKPEEHHEEHGPGDCHRHAVSALPGHGATSSADRCLDRIHEDAADTRGFDMQLASRKAANSEDLPRGHEGQVAFVWFLSLVQDEEEAGDEARLPSTAPSSPAQPSRSYDPTDDVPLSIRHRQRAGTYDPLP